VGQNLNPIGNFMPPFTTNPSSNPSIFKTKEKTDRGNKPLSQVINFCIRERNPRVLCYFTASTKQRIIGLSRSRGCKGFQFIDATSWKGRVRGRMLGLNRHVGHQKRSFFVRLIWGQICRGKMVTIKFLKINN